MHPLVKYCIYRSMLLLLLICQAVPAQFLHQRSPVHESYAYVHGGSFSGVPVTVSPDPLVSYRWQNPRDTDGLEIYLLKPVTVKADRPGSFRNLASLTGEKTNVSVQGTGSILLDFGRESAGWLEFDSDDFCDSVEMSISEYNEPAILNAGAQSPVKTKVPVRYGNTYRLELNDMLYEGVRFGWIHVRSFTKPWHITGVRLVCQTKPANYNGSFLCSDPALEKIWYTGAYVVKLNLLKDYFGAILMERSDRFSWTGDAYPSQAASLVAFGNFDFVRTNLGHTAGQNNGIASYALYWVLSLLDYYNYTGDTATMNKYLANACAKLEKAYKQYGTNPELGFYGWDERLGAGFEDPNCPEAENAYRMLSIRAWYDFAMAMRKFGREDLKEKYQHYADSKVEELRASKEWYQSFGLHAAADAITAGFTTPGEQSAMYNHEFRDRVNRLSYSPFNEYTILQALAAMGKYDDAVSSVKDCWGGQLAYGGTTFFEVYRPSWNQVLGMNDAPPNNQCGYTSLAHPWGAGVTKWLSEEILGIKPTTPGFSTYSILPHLGRALTNVAGKTLTPYGEIKASFDVKTGRCIVSAPEGTCGMVGIPKAEKKVDTIFINGKLAWNGKFIGVKGIGNAREDTNFVYFTGVKPGTYNFSVTYSGTTPALTELSWHYPAKFVQEDSLTGGDWGGVYGHDGRLLFNYFPKDSNLAILPVYVKSVTCTKNFNLSWAIGVIDKRAPAPDNRNGFPRNAGYICTRDPRACDQTMTVDVVLTNGSPVQMALYFVDWDNKARKTAIEMFDLETKKMVAPVKIVKNYARGRYIIYEYNRSVRFRINQVRGTNAVLTAIFFDH